MKVIRTCVGCANEYTRIENGLILPEALARDVFRRTLFCDNCLADLAAALELPEPLRRASRLVVTDDRYARVYVDGWRSALDAAKLEVVDGPLKALRGQGFGMLDTFRKRLAADCEAILQRLQIKNPLADR